MSKNRRKIITLIFVITFIIMSIGASFAFFTAISTSAVSSSTKVTSATTNTLTFAAGEPLLMHATQDNFGNGMASLKNTTYATATLKKGSVDTALYKYNVSFVLEKNDFLYSTPEKSPELLLNITDDKNILIKEIPGLTFKTVNGMSGFDITKMVGTFNIKTNYIITTDNLIVHKWIAEVIFVNKNENQDINKGKKLNGYLRLELAE
ncbi:MAG: hypothetical protein RR478_04850 [Bacilli bacterium]